MSDEELKKEWDRKLLQSGFIDIEDSKRRLKSKDIRTQNYINKEIILDFFLSLDAFLNDNDDIPGDHRAILERYTQGQYLKAIAKDTDYSVSGVKLIIEKYRKKILNGV